MASYAAEAAALTGVIPTSHAAAATDICTGNDGRLILRVVNGDAAPTTVTINDPSSQAPVGSTGFNPDVVVTVAAGVTKVIGPFPFNRFGASLDLAFSNITSVTWTAIRLP